MTDQELLDWVEVENRNALGIEIPEGWTLEADSRFVQFDRYGGTIDCGEDPLCGGRLDSPIAGATFHADKLIVVYRPGLTEGFASVSLLNADSAPGVAIRGIPNVSRAGRAVMTVVHEAAHARGIDVVPGMYFHPNAEQFSIDAYDRFRALFKND